MNAHKIGIINYSNKDISKDFILKFLDISVKQKNIEVYGLDNGLLENKNISGLLPEKDFNNFNFHIYLFFGGDNVTVNKEAYMNLLKLGRPIVTTPCLGINLYDNKNSLLFYSISDLFEKISFIIKNFNKSLDIVKKFAPNKPPRKPTVSKKTNKSKPFLSKMPGNIKLDKNQTNATSVLGQIIQNRRVNQEFQSNFDNLSGVQIKVATYNRSVQGIWTVNILSELNDVNSIVRSVEIDTSKFKDNDWVTINFEPIKESKNKKFFLQIIGQKTNGNAATVYFDPSSKELGGILYINKNKFMGNLTMKTFYSIIQGL